MQLREFRGKEFVNREKEIEYLKNRFEKNPEEILWLYGPKSTGKTTLIEYIIENELTSGLKIFDKYWIKYINFRGMMIGNYDSFINSFFEKVEKDDFTNEIKAGFDIGIFKLEAKILEQIKNRDKNMFHELIEKFKKINKTKILVLDEIQTLEDIYYNGEKELLKEFLNFCVRLTKELHLAHVVILSSNTIFIDQIYNDAKLKVTSEFKKIDHLDKETIFEYLEYKGIREKELIWEYLGGCIPLVQRCMRNVEYYDNTQEYLNYVVKLTKNEIIDLIDKNFDDREQEIFKDIIKKVLEFNGYVLPEGTKKEIYEIVDFMTKREIFFYDPLERKVTGNNRLYEKAFEDLLYSR
ncbi:MAG: ATP-binding protein [Desulfonauticus sp.]|nr:ATP-binding protein [Desulfonauticus sp.]